MESELQNKLYERYNYDDVFNRNVIIGLLDLLNHKMHYDQIWDDNVVEKVYVPFMYDFGSSDERFAQDNYTFFGTTCFADKKIDGKFDMMPRGAVRYTGSSIDAGNMTNRTVQAKYLRNENGRLTSYVSYLCSIPLTFNFEIELWIDNILTAFKIESAIRTTFYKNRTFYVMYKGMKIHCTAGFPESSTLEKTTSYQFDSERQIKMTFSLAVETYQPVLDETTAIEASKPIEHVAFDVEALGYTKRDIRLEFKNFEGGVIYPCGTNVLLEWNAQNTISDLCTLKLSYVDETGKEGLVDYIDYPHRSYIWHVPEQLGEFVQPTIVFNDQEAVVEEPVIKIIPGSKGFINEDSFVIVDPGLFRTEIGADAYLPITIEYSLDDGSVRISESYSVHVVNRVIDTEAPVVINGDKMRYEGPIKTNEIQFKLSYPLDETKYTLSDKVLII